MTNRYNCRHCGAFLEWNPVGRFWYHPGLTSAYVCEQRKKEGRSKPQHR